MCYCGSELAFEQCCQPFINNTAIPSTAEQLMRSRFSAYVINKPAYIQQTYAKEKHAENTVQEIADFATSCRFVALTVINTEQHDNQAWVEFEATYFYQNLFCKLHERSYFELRDTVWYYVDGVITPTADIKIGRNDVCPCGSDKKYKKCHG